MDQSKKYTPTPDMVSVLALKGLPLMYVKLLSTRRDQSCSSLLLWPAASAAAGAAAANRPSALPLPAGAPAAAAAAAA
jgi:hypothetical protein